MPPHREDFARWLDDPVTRYVIRAHLAMAEANRVEWIKASWGGGACSKEMLSELRTRADAYKAIAEMDYAALVAANEDEPNDE